jgi:hypothetical protein
MKDNIRPIAAALIVAVIANSANAQITPRQPSLTAVAAITRGATTGSSAPVYPASGGTGVTTATRTASDLRYQQGASESIVRSPEMHLRDTVQATDFGADPTFTKDSVAAINAALATGKNVRISPGHYIIKAGWIDMTSPRQKLYCDGPATVLTVKRGAVNPTPALVLETSAIGAQFDGCTIDHDGAQFLGTGPYVPLTWNNTTTGTHSNDGLGNAVLIMANYAKFSGVVTRGWDNCIGLGNFNLKTGIQTGSSPIQPSVDRTTTSYCGSGVHSWTPNYNQGAGVDVLTATGAIVSNSKDYHSYDGFWVDTSGGASASFSNLTSYYARMTPKLTSSYGWHTTYAGIGFYLSGADRNFNGSISAGMSGTSCVNCTAVQPAAQGLQIDQHSNGVSVTNFHAYRPGLECIWDRSGQAQFTNVLCDSANYLAGNTAYGIAAPITAAIQVDASNTSGVTSQFQNTHAKFVGLTIAQDPTRAPNYHYALSLANYGAVATVSITNGNITAGTAGAFYRPVNTMLQVIDPVKPSPDQAAHPQ